VKHCNLVRRETITCSAEIVNTLAVRDRSGCVVRVCVQCMEVLHTWGPDIFHLSEVADGNPLTPVTYTILTVSGSVAGARTTT